MKQEHYRSSYKERKPFSRLYLLRAVLLVLFAVLILLIYKDRIGSFFGADSSAQASKPLKSSKKGIPALTVNLDGKNYWVEGTKVLSVSSALPDASQQRLDFFKNSSLDISFEDQPDSYNMMLYKENSVVLSGQKLHLAADDLTGDGEYICVYEGTWKSGKNKGKISYSFTLAVDFPYELAISSSETDPGELLVICALNLNADESLEVETDLDYKPNAFQYGNKRIILLPVSYYNEPGKVYQVRVNIGGEVFSYAVKVNEKNFTTQYMTIDTKVAAATRNEKSAKEIDEKLDPLKPVSDQEPYWSGKFLMPVEGGRVTEADFGKRRYVNNAPTSYRHNGLDIGQDKGTPVMASNNGRVLIADKLIETGNTIVIEHGFGLKTWYYHMDELLVKTGDRVIQGEIIGKVGSTGFSTSPHLHFSATINNVFITPVTLVEKGVPLLEFN